MDEDRIPLSLMLERHLNFLLDVKSVLNNKIHDENTYLAENEKQIFNILEEMFALTAELEIFISLSKRESANYNVLKTNPKWKEVCENSIVKLREIGPSMHRKRFCCNLIRGIGYFLSLVGGTATFASAAGINFHPIISSAITGGSMTVAGCSIAFFTSVTETALLRAYVKKAQEIIEEYIKHYPIRLDHVAEANPLSEILKIDIMNRIVQSVKELVDKGTKIKDDRQRLDYIKGAVNFIMSYNNKARVDNKADSKAQVDNEADNKAQVDNEADNNAPVISNTAVANIISALVNMFFLLLNTKDRLVFDFPSLTIRSFFHVEDCPFIVMKLFRANAKGTSEYRFTHGAFSFFEIMLDIDSLAWTYTDIHMGSSCPEADRIINAIEEFEKEAKLVRKIYDRIK